ncbi:hypothetical protein L1987_31912 [Smallanthus sonchifolius]|uniref:Uncharacterized protein n=1 Tax=Smallanthus sonchifolius TaxID=185202 RepID=A0ACB9I8P3_9ASTR|nr:hypothetical protein L1987_31912 [Smallanthus sonchifolius]
MRKRVFNDMRYKSKKSSFLNGITGPRDIHSGIGDRTRNAPDLEAVGPEKVYARVKNTDLEVIKYMFAHAISLSHPGIRCRCLAAYGDAVSAVEYGKCIYLRSSHCDAI